MAVIEAAIRDPQNGCRNKVRDELPMKKNKFQGSDGGARNASLLKAGKIETFSTKIKQTLKERNVFCS